MCWGWIMKHLHLRIQDSEKSRDPYTPGTAFRRVRIIDDAISKRWGNPYAPPKSDLIKPKKKLAQKVDEWTANNPDKIDAYRNFLKSLHRNFVVEIAQVGLSLGWCAIAFHFLHPPPVVGIVCTVAGVAGVAYFAFRNRKKTEDLINNPDNHK